MFFFVALTLFIVGIALGALATSAAYKDYWRLYYFARFRRRSRALNIVRRPMSVSPALPEITVSPDTIRVRETRSTTSFNRKGITQL